MKTRRIAGLLTTLAMVLSMMGAPLPAMAAVVADLSSESATATVEATPTAKSSAEATAAVVSKKVAPAATVTPSAVVCEIGATTYPTLYDALVAVQDGETITLVADVTEAASLVMDQGFAFSIDKAGFDLTLTNDLDIGLSTDVTIKGAGATVFEGETYVTNNARLMVNGDLTCYWLDANTQGEIHVAGNVTSTYDDPSDYFSVNITGGTVTIDGSVTTAGAGAFVSRGSDVTVTVGGSVTSAGTALCAEDGGRITVTGDVTSTASDAISADSGAQVTVIGNVSASGSDASDGIYANGDKTVVTVTGDISCVSDNGNGIESLSNAVVTVTGNITSIGSDNYSIYARSGSQVTVTGDISADAGIAACARDAGTKVAVTGDLTTAQGYPGVSAWDGAAVTINGNVTATGEGAAGVEAARAGTLVTINGDITSDDTGVYVSDKAGVIVNGTITAPTYITFGYGIEEAPDLSVTAGDFVEPTTMAGYKTYTDDISNVWVKAVSETKPEPLPIPKTKPLGLPGTGDSSSLKIPVILMGYALIALTGFYFVKRNRRIDTEEE